MLGYFKPSSTRLELLVAHCTELPTYRTSTNSVPPTSVPACVSYHASSPAAQQRVNSPLAEEESRVAVEAESIQNALDFPINTRFIAGIQVFLTVCLLVGYTWYIEKHKTFLRAIEVSHTACKICVWTERSISQLMIDIFSMSNCCCHVCHPNFVEHERQR